MNFDTKTTIRQLNTVRVDLCSIGMVESVLIFAQISTGIANRMSAASAGNKKDFTYFALCRGVQIMGATLTVERNAELEQILC